jgi:zinc transporter ZupT
MSHYQALALNFLSALPGLLGFYIGISVSREAQVGSWILTITAGIFIYVALVDLMPNLLPNSKWNWKMFFIVNLALILGFFIMFLLIIFEKNVEF